jgi:hypothetical protein
VVQPTAGVVAVGAGEPVLGGIDAEVGGLDAQRGVVADHRRRSEVGLADRGADDPVVGHGGVEPVLDEQVLADVVDLDLQRGGAVAGGDGLGERAAVGDPQLLERAQRGAGRPADVVGPALEAVEFLDDRERNDDVGVGELEDAGRIGDQHGGVDDEPGSLASPRPIGPVRCLIGHRGSVRQRTEAGRSPSLLGVSLVDSMRIDSHTQRMHVVASDHRAVVDARISNTGKGQRAMSLHMQ